MDAVLALHTGLAGRPVEALTTLTYARTVHPVQADPVSKAGVLGLPGAGLALGAKEARTAFSCLKQKDKAEPALPSAGFVQQCRHPAGGTGCVPLVPTPSCRGCENP